MKNKPLRAAIQKLAGQYKFNDSGLADDLFAGSLICFLLFLAPLTCKYSGFISGRKADVICTMLAHLRRIKDDPVRSNLL